MLSLTINRTFCQKSVKKNEKKLCMSDLNELYTIEVDIKM